MIEKYSKNKKLFKSEKFKDFIFIVQWLFFILIQIAVFIEIKKNFFGSRQAFPLFSNPVIWIGLIADVIFILPFFKIALKKQAKADGKKMIQEALDSDMLG